MYFFNRNSHKYAKVNNGFPENEATENGEEKKKTSSVKRMVVVVTLCICVFIAATLIFIAVNRKEISNSAYFNSHFGVEEEEEEEGGGEHDNNDNKDRIEPYSEESKRLNNNIVPEKKKGNNNNKEEEEEETVDEEMFEIAPSDFQLTEKGKALWDDLPNLCPRWSKQFTKKFRSRCQFWLNTLSQYDALTGKRYGPATYNCISLSGTGEEICHGVGDRITGMQGVLMFAINQKRPFRAHWVGLPRIFSPCVLHTKYSNWTLKASSDRECEVSALDECDSPKNLECARPSQPKFYNNLDRSCIPNGVCVGLKKQFPASLNTADIFGCSLRAMLEPTADFLTNMKVPFRENGKVLEHSVRDIESIMKKYFVIGIHFRLGDVVSFQKNSFRLGFENRHLLYPFHCAFTLQSHLFQQRVVDPSEPVNILKDSDEYISLLGKGGEEEEKTYKGKPVRWFLASDSETLRELAIKLYGNKLLMVDFKPQHVALVKRNERTVTLARTFAEWLILGYSDELIANRIAENGKQIVFNGRISAFPKTAWVYQLKHMFYDAGTCRRIPIPIDGNWQEGKASTKACWNSPVFQMQFPQPHLSVKNFPETWVQEGKVYGFADRKKLLNGDE